MEENTKCNRGIAQANCSVCRASSSPTGSSNASKPFCRSVITRRPNITRKTIKKSSSAMMSTRRHRPPPTRAPGISIVQHSAKSLVCSPYSATSAPRAFDAPSLLCACKRRRVVSGGSSVESSVGYIPAPLKHSCLLSIHVRTEHTESAACTRTIPRLRSHLRRCQHHLLSTCAGSCAPCFSPRPCCLPPIALKTRGFGNKRRRRRARLNSPGLPAPGVLSISRRILR